MLMFNITIRIFIFQLPNLNTASINFSTWMNVASSLKMNLSQKPLVVSVFLISCCSTIHKASLSGDQMEAGYILYQTVIYIILSFVASCSWFNGAMLETFSDLVHLTLWYGGITTAFSFTQAPSVYHLVTELLKDVSFQNFI